MKIDKLVKKITMILMATLALVVLPVGLIVVIVLGFMKFWVLGAVGILIFSTYVFGTLNLILEERKSHEAKGKNQL